MSREIATKTQPYRRSLRRISIGAPAALLVTTIGTAQQVPVRPLAIDDAIATKTFESTSAIRVSRNGHEVAYTLTNPARVHVRNSRHGFYLASGVPIQMEGCEVWVVDTRTGVMKNVGGDKGSSWGPAWSPDGRLLAFYSDRDGLLRLWIWDTSTGRLRRPSDMAARAMSGMDPARWLPDGRELVIKLISVGMPLAESFPKIRNDSARSWRDTGTTATVYRYMPPSRETAAPDAATSAPADRGAASQFMSDLAVVNLATGSVRRIVHQEPIAMFSVSPTGAYIAYSLFTGTDGASQQVHYDFAIASLSSGQSRIVARRVPQAMGLNMSWSPNGNYLAYSQSSYGPLSNNPPTRGDCFVVKAAGGEPVNVTPGVHPDFENAFRKPIWNSKGDRIFLIAQNEVWSTTPAGSLTRVASVPDHVIRQIIQTGEEGPPWSPDSGHSLYLTTFANGSKRVGFARIDAGSGAVSQLVEEERAYSPLPFGFSAEGGSVYYVAEDARHSQDIWRARIEFADRQQLSRVNPQLDAYAFGEQRLVHWLSDDGTPLSGALLLPAGYQPGRRYPLVVSVYGGATLSDDVYHYGLSSLVLANDQLLATRGFAVLAPDEPLRVGTPMRDVASAVLPGVNKVIELGIADPARLAVMGQSYGGYNTVALITQTTRFKAAVSVSGLSDLISAYSFLTPSDMASAIGWAEAGQGRMGGTPWEYRDRYIENSPFFYLDRVRTPLLLVHGSLDTAVPPFLGEQTFVALRRLGREAMYVNYVGEGHGISGARNVLDYTERVMSWLAEHTRADTVPRQ